MSSKIKTTIKIILSTSYLSQKWLSTFLCFSQLLHFVNRLGADGFDGEISAVRDTSKMELNMDWILIF